MLSKQDTAFIKKTIFNTVIAFVFLFNIGTLIMINIDWISAQTAVLTASSANYDDSLMQLDLLEEKGVKAELIAKSRYRIAEKMTRQGDYDKAIELFRTLGSYSDSEEKIINCRYLKAKDAYKSGELSQAYDLFYTLGDYRDSYDYYCECAYIMAENALTDGNWSLAVQLFNGVSGYKDSAERAVSVAIEYTGSDNIAAILENVNTLSAEELAQLDKYQKIEEKFPEGLIAAGYYHTLGLKSNGKVLSCGLNEDGQCETSQWSDIVQIAAGAYHSVGLKRDGTVVAVGRNAEGQCDVESWSDVVQIAASGFNTFALKADGTVLFCGNLDYPELEELSGVIEIVAGNYGAAAILSDRSIVSLQSSAEIPEDGAVVDFSMSTGYSIALLADGTTFSNFEKANSIKNAVRVSAGSTAFFIVTDDYKLITHFFRESDSVEIDTGRKYIDACAGGTHHLLLTRAGNVIAFGDNTFGQCNTEKWDLIS